MLNLHWEGGGHETHFQGEGCKLSEISVQNGMGGPILDDKNQLNPPPSNTSPGRRSRISQKIKESPKGTPRRKREEREECENVAKRVKNELSSLYLPPTPQRCQKQVPQCK